MVFSFDEKTPCQALDRTQPSLPLKPGRSRTMTHDYKRNGTIVLFAAMNVGTGEVLHQTRKRHTAKDVLAFFKWIDLHVARDLEIHVVLDNLSAHSAPPVADWLAHPKRARWHLHFTPTSASRLNLVEGWFAQLTNKRLKYGSFDSVDSLTTERQLFRGARPRRRLGGTRAAWWHDLIRDDPSGPVRAALLGRLVDHLREYLLDPRPGPEPKRTRYV